MIIQNAIKIIEDKKNPIYIVSGHRHAFEEHWFGDGEYIAADGGHDYIRRIGNLDLENKRYKEWSLSSKNNFKTICNRLLWRTNGKNGDEELKYVLLKDCTKTHLKAILKTQPQIKGTIYEKVIKYWLKTNK